MKTRKMVIRADDIGYTDVCNIGTFKAIDAGLVTQMDVMLECPGSVDAFRRIRNYPWISMGWHMHFWGSPVLDPREVPSLLAENGHFKQSLAKHTDIEYDEIYREMDAQMQRCMEIAGRIPQVSSMYDPGPDATPFQLAAIEICKKYNIHYGFATRLNKQQDVDSGRHPALVQPAREPYRDLDIAQPGPGFAYQGLKDGPLGSYTQYDPIKNYLIADPDHLAEHRVGGLAPGICGRLYNVRRQSHKAAHDVEPRYRRRVDDE